MLDERPYVREKDERVLHIWGDDGYLGGRCKTISDKADIDSVYYLKILKFIEQEESDEVIQRQLHIICKRCLKELVK